jgi:hypothetical protein
LATGGALATGGSTSTGGACGDPILKANYTSCAASADPQTCADRGGTWQTAFSAYCSCPTGEGDCPCDKASDCTVACLAANPSPPLGDCSSSTSGKCAERPVNGCYCIFTGTAGASSPICWD